jgi:hypothetical protein
LLGRFAELTNRFQVWYQLPFMLAMPTIVGHRVNMREHNLSDTERDPSLLKPGAGANGHDQRTADGSYNDLGCPWMGMAGARFGRNVPISDTHGEQPPELYEPNPRQVSRDLLARRSFVPVPHLNVLVPAWLQFMVHDWLSHGGGDTKTPPHRLPLPPGDARRIRANPQRIATPRPIGGTARSSTAPTSGGSMRCAPIRRAGNCGRMERSTSMRRDTFRSIRPAMSRTSSSPA